MTLSADEKLLHDGQPRELYDFELAGVADQFYTDFRTDLSVLSNTYTRADISRSSIIVGHNRFEALEVLIPRDLTLVTTILTNVAPREILFTLVDNETRFKSKPVIDTVVYRGGDVATAWFYTALGTVFKFKLVGIALVGGGVAVIWAFVGAYLGGLFEKRSKTENIEHGTE